MVDSNEAPKLIKAHLKVFKTDLFSAGEGSNGWRAMGNSSSSVDLP